MSERKDYIPKFFFFTSELVDWAIEKFLIQTDIDYIVWDMYTLRYLSHLLSLLSYSPPLYLLFFPPFPSLIFLISLSS